MRRTFVVGRLSARGAEVVLADRVRAPAPFPGPWRLRALVRPADNPPAPDSENPTVH